MASMFQSIRSIFRNWGRKPSALPTGAVANPSGNEPWPKVIQEEFVLDRKLGEGGMGTVFLVRSKTTGQTFAVKGTKLRDENSRRDFLTELQTWLDLPEHPHLTACRFFRTVQDQVLVFAEYVDGGSLHDWIRQRKLTRLEQILDVAIQFAWGLHAAHEAGLVHQDVKPGNVLLTRDGLVKVSDPQLSVSARALIEDLANDVEVSPASYGQKTFFTPKGLYSTAQGRAAHPGLIRWPAHPGLIRWPAHPGLIRWPAHPG